MKSLRTMLLAAVAILPVAAMAASPDDTRIAAPGMTLVDYSGTKWTLDAAGNVYINGKRDGTSAHVVTMAYEDGKVWQMNASHTWWYRSNGGWQPTLGTHNSPLPALTVSVTNGNLNVHTDPYTFVGVDAWRDGCTACAGTANAVYLTGGLGNFSIPAKSTGFIAGASYWQITELNRAVVMDPATGIYLDVTRQNYFTADELQSRLAYNDQEGIYPYIADWSTDIANMIQNQPARWATFAARAFPTAAGATPVAAYVMVNGQERDPTGKRYIVTNYHTATNVGAAGGVYLDVDTVGVARIFVKGGSGTQGYYFNLNSVAAVQIGAPY